MSRPSGHMWQVVLSGTARSRKETLTSTCIKQDAVASGAMGRCRMLQETFGPDQSAGQEPAALDVTLKRGHKG